MRSRIHTTIQPDAGNQYGPPKSPLDGYVRLTYLTVLTGSDDSPLMILGPMPYVKDIFYAKVSPLADIVQLSSNNYDELEEDFKTKYAGVKAIYHSRDPGSYFGDLKEEFFKRVPKSCQVVSHCECSCLTESYVLDAADW